MKNAKIVSRKLFEAAKIPSEIDPGLIPYSHFPRTIKVYPGIILRTCISKRNLIVANYLSI